MMKKWISMMLAGVLLCSIGGTGCFAETSGEEIVNTDIKTKEVETEEYLSGDINFDGSVDLSDAQTVLEAALGIITLTSEQEFIVDNITVTDYSVAQKAIGLDDAVRILKYALNIEEPVIVKKEKPIIFYSTVLPNVYKYDYSRIFNNKEDVINWAKEYQLGDMIKKAEGLSEDDFTDHSLMIYITMVHADKIEDVQPESIMIYNRKVFIKYQDYNDILDDTNSLYLEMSFIQKEKSDDYYFIKESEITGGETCNIKTCLLYGEKNVEEGYTVVHSKDELEKYKEKIFGMIGEETRFDYSPERKKIQIAEFENLINKDEDYFKDKTLLLYQKEINPYNPYIKLSLEETSTELKVKMNHRDVYYSAKPDIYVFPYLQVFAIELSNDLVNNKQITMNADFSDYN